MTDLRRAVAELKKGGSLTLSNVPEGYDAFCIAELAHALAREAEKRAVVFVHVARDEQRARAFTEALAFASPAIEVLDFPPGIASLTIASRPMPGSPPGA